jgi:hypothetical protein
MLYIKRGQDGRIAAVSQEQQPEGWEAISPDAPELAAFTQLLASGQKELITTDLGLVRVVEDLIDLLIERDTIRFTDFPEAAQTKLLARRSLRSSLRSLQLLDEENGREGLL